MGEKVYTHAAGPAQPLNYAEPALMPRWTVRLMGMVDRVGGVRQIVFAVGLACILAATALAFAPVHTSDASGFLAFLGGLMMGMVIRVPLRLD